MLNNIFVKYNYYYYESTSSIYINVVVQKYVYFNTFYIYTKNIIKDKSSRNIRSIVQFYYNIKLKTYTNEVK